MSFPPRPSLTPCSLLFSLTVLLKLSFCFSPVSSALPDQISFIYAIMWSAYFRPRTVLSPGVFPDDSLKSPIPTPSISSRLHVPIVYLEASDGFCSVTFSAVFPHLPRHWEYPPKAWLIACLPLYVFHFACGSYFLSFIVPVWCCLYQLPIIVW